MKLGFKVQANFGASWALIGFLVITLWQKCMLYLEGEDSVDRVRSGVSTRVHANLTYSLLQALLVSILLLLLVLPLNLLLLIVILFVVK